MKIPTIVSLCILLFTNMMPLFVRTASALPSSDMVIAQVETGAPASEVPGVEMTLLYNASDQDVNITGWCIEYSAASNGSGFIRPVCITAEDTETDIWVRSGGFVSFASEQFADAYPDFVVDFSMHGGYASGGGHVRLLNADQIEVDRVGWGSAVSPETAPIQSRNEADSSLTRLLGATPVDSDNNAADFVHAPVFSYTQSGIYEQSNIELVDACTNIDGFQSVVPDGYMQAEQTMCFADACTNIPGLQRNIPIFYEYSESGDCQMSVPDEHFLVINEVYANAPGSDTGQEFIEIYNPNDFLVELRGYVLEVVGTQTQSYVLGSHTLSVDSYWHVGDQDSGIILPNTQAQVRLLTASGVVVSQTDSYANPDEGASWSRIDDTWQYSDQATPGVVNVPSTVTVTPVDVCANIDGSQESPPDGYMVDGTDCAMVIELEDSVLVVTELYPNAPSYDTGQEFIEIYNPNSYSVDLSGYIIRLDDNPDNDFIFEQGTIDAGEYIILSDSVSGITLPNSSSFVQLIAPSSDVVSVSEPYQSPDDDKSWALIDGVWQYTDQVTQGSGNVGSVVEMVEQQTVEAADGLESAVLDEGTQTTAVTLAAAVGTETVSTSNLVPCRSDQFRNPLTNRCKKIDDTETALVPCVAGQERNPATNRCRSIAPVTTALAACKEGQFRNPETNRCKAIAASQESQLVPCAEGQERNPATNRCRKSQAVLGATDGGLPKVTDIEVEATLGSVEWIIPAVLAAAVGGYMLYEWRFEIVRRLRSVRS